MISKKPDQKEKSFALAANNKYWGNKMKNSSLKYFNTINKALALILVTIALCFSCAPLPITVEEFDDNIGIRKGQDATLKWKIANADRVKMEGSPHEFGPYDSIMVSPDKTSAYKFIAYQGNTDSLELVSEVFVDPGAGYSDYDKVNSNEREEYGSNDEIKIGPSILKQTKLSASYIPSDYFRGIKSYNESKGPVRLKVLKTVYPYNDKNFLVRALLLDENGNFLVGDENALKGSNWTAENSYENVRMKHNPKKVTEANDSTLQKHLDIGIVLDNSAASESGNGILDYIIQFTSYLTVKDNVAFSFFNQNYMNTLPLMSADRALWNMNNKINTNVPNSGLNALYKASYKTARQLAAGDNKEKVMVIITYYADNSSIIYTANDVASLAGKYNIPIYIIGIGDALKSYEVKYLSSVSGGRFYYLPMNETGNISDILTEISLSQRFYYEFEIPANQKNKSKEISYRISYKEPGFNLEEKLSLIMRQYAQYSQYQALATFHEKDIKVRKEYYSNIESLAKTLKDNPDSKIQLIGHSGMEGNTGFNFDLAGRRAAEVKSLLHEYGASSQQVSIKAEGNSKPIFYFEQEKWQGYFNRRVEVRWLDPSILPYEIIVEYTETENDALSRITYWENKGYRAYFDRYLQNNQPVYRVKLWGYPTIAEAEKAVEQLENKYKQKCTVE